MSPQHDSHKSSIKNGCNRWTARMLGSVAGVEVVVVVMADYVVASGKHALEEIRARPEVLKRATQLIQSKVILLLPDP